MDSLPYRASVFLRPTGLHGGQLDLMERSFAQEADAVCWCEAMSEAQPLATGVWLVAMSKGGRLMTLTRESGFSLAAGLCGPLGSSPAPDELGSVLVEAGLTAAPVLSVGAVKMELVGSA